MPYAMLYQYFPEIAKSETRTVTILREGDYDLPAGNYGFLEMFCNESGCDCRRVFFCVVSEKFNQVEAYITYGWESPSYYRKWLGFDDPYAISELKGPALNVGSPQSSLAPALLNFVRETLLRDEAYVDRIKRHYHLFRAKIESKGKSGRTHGKRKRKKKS
ncbi:MAG TPA: hypothetical protein DDZ34_05320 [Syntrophaceae bacterium]|jgi:hypothetical protein|nr:hypothetical protein [Syntrophaceae bacterium]